MTATNTGNQQTTNTGTQTSKRGGHSSPLTDATYNMVTALSNLTEGLWRYDEYIADENDSDAKEMWQRFKQTQSQMAEELKNHLSRRLQHETGPQGKVGHGPNEQGGTGRQ